MEKNEIAAAINETGIELMTIHDLMNVTGLKRTAAYNLVRSKGFPRVYIGGSLRIPKLLFIAWMLDSCAYKPKVDMNAVLSARRAMNA